MGAEINIQGELYHQLTTSRPTNMSGKGRVAMKAVQTEASKGLHLSGGDT